MALTNGKPPTGRWLQHAPSTETRRRFETAGALHKKLLDRFEDLAQSPACPKPGQSEAAKTTQTEEGQSRWFRNHSRGDGERKCACPQVGMFATVLIGPDVDE